MSMQLQEGGRAGGRVRVEPIMQTWQPREPLVRGRPLGERAGAARGRARAASPAASCGASRGAAPAILPPAHLALSHMPLVCASIWSRVGSSQGPLGAEVLRRGHQGLGSPKAAMSRYLEAGSLMFSLPCGSSGQGSGGGQASLPCGSGGRGGSQGCRARTTPRAAQPARLACGPQHCWQRPRRAQPLQHVRTCSCSW